MSLIISYLRNRRCSAALEQQSDGYRRKTEQLHKQLFNFLNKPSLFQNLIEWIR